MRYADIAPMSSEVRARNFAEVGLRVARLSAEQRARTPAAVDAIGLTPEFLGAETFAMEAGFVRGWIDANCRDEWLSEPILDLGGEIVGVCYRFADKDEADRFDVAFFGPRAGQPSS